MVESIGSGSNSISQLQMQRTKKSPEDMFNDLASKVGADSSGITKEQLQAYADKLKESGGDSKESEMINKMLKDFDTLSGGSDKITADTMKTGMEKLKPQGGPQGAPPQGGKPPSADEIYSDMSSKVGADSTGITKDQLQSYLDKLKESGDDEEAGKISNLIKDFDTLSGGTDKITASTLQTGLDSIFGSKTSSSSGRYDFQDPSTISTAQRQSPVDLKV